MLRDGERLDVNCTQHITARFTESEIVDATVVLGERIAALEAENAGFGHKKCRASWQTACAPHTTLTPSPNNSITAPMFAVEGGAIEPRQLQRQLYSRHPQHR